MEYQVGQVHGRQNGHADLGSAPVKRARRRTGLKRSRTGCGTCKRRGKKCDEEWNEQGFCQRCVMGEFECAGRTEASSSISTFAAQSTRDARWSVSDSARPEQSTETSSSASSSTPPQTALQTDSDLASVTQSSTLGHHAITTNSAALNTHPMPLAASNMFLPSASSSNDTTASFFTGFTAPQPMPQWTNAFGSTSNTNIQSQPFLPTTLDAPLSLDSSSFSWSNYTSADIWNDLTFSFATPSPTVGSNTTSTAEKPASQLSGFGASDPRLLFVNGEKPMRQGVSLAEIYARVVESWLIGLPSTTRDYARTRILALNDNNSVLRNVRYAVAAAYIFLFASDHKEGKEPQPKLIEMAWKGAGIVDGQPGSGTAIATLTTAPPRTSEASATKASNRRNNTIRKEAGSATREENEISGDGKASKKLRSYVDHVSTPFAADLESRKWTEDAVQELREVIVTDQAQLSDLLWGVIDLQLVEFIRGGAAPSYNMLALGDRLVRSAMGDNHPPITLKRLRTSDTLSLRFYALSDISRCIVQRGRKTIFNFWTDVGDDDTTTQMVENGDEEPWATYLGLPDSIVILLAEVVNLCAELSCSTTTSIKAQADELEAALRGWQSQTFSTTDSVDSAALVSRTIAGELWRLSALVLLYQSVHRVGGLHPVLRRAQSEILSLLDSITRLPNGDLWGFIALPAFLAASLSINENDRKRVLKHLQRPGPERVWLDNIALIEKLWEEVDETGKLPDWHDKMTREGLSVAFF